MSTYAPPAPQSMKASPIDSLIAPEIRNDEFHHLLGLLASKKTFQNILEIGSSSGAGSTDAFVRAIRSRTDRSGVRLFCMEVSRTRFQALQSAYAGDSFVHCYNVSSVLAHEFPTEAQVAAFYRDTPTNLNNYRLATVLEWLRSDIAYVSALAPAEDGISRILRENGLGHFDLVLIDGSEFSGVPELGRVMGSLCIALDDINCFKNWANYRALRADPAYVLLHENWQLRNGFALFMRTDLAASIGAAPARA